MTKQVISGLLSLEGVRCFPGVGTQFAGSEILGNRKLPEAHVVLLSESNGVEAYFGYFRLFGIAPSNFIDALNWNDRAIWKFAWAGRADNYWCFGETAWGDQFAYNLSELKRGVEDIFFLDALSMTPKLIAASFAEFWNDEFLRSAKQPYDLMTIAAHKAMGSLRPDLHLAYVPSPLLGGEEKIENVLTMPAAVAMVCNGDIAVQLDGRPRGKVRAVERYEDDANRSRIRLLWE